MGGRHHHDQAFADFLGTGGLQLAFWNQKVSTLLLAERPANPREATAWPLTPIVTDYKPNGVPYVEGMSVFDVNADGRPDLLACDTWFKHTGGKEIKAVKFAAHCGLILAGYFKPSKYPQIVVSPGDAIGPLRLYECTGDPLNAADWTRCDLQDREIVHGHSLQLGDIDRDGHPDIFVAEKAKWSARQPQPNDPGAVAWIFYGDGQGNFRKTELATGLGWHEVRLRDLARRRRNFQSRWHGAGQGRHPFLLPPEFVPRGKGRTLFDAMAEKLEPKLVGFEIDIFWATHGGQDPVKLMQKYPGRWDLMHFKDMRAGNKGDLSGAADKQNDVAVGSGIIDAAAAIREGARQGIKHHLIEDESPNPLGQIPQSLRYLESLSWRNSAPTPKP